MTAPPEEKQKTILLVEDEALIALAEKKALAARGYRVITASSGEKALELVESSGDFDLILMDIDLGKGIDGAEAAKLILQNRATPIVFLSSHTEPEMVDKTEKITSYGYVAKSSSVAALDASIRMAFKLFEANRKVQTTNEMFRKVLDSIPQFICWKNLRSEFLGCNKNFADLSGLPDTQSIVGKTDWDLPWTREQTELFLMDDAKVMSRDEPAYHILERASDAKGRKTWLETNKVPLHDVEGKVNGVLVAFSDITEAKAIEDSLAEEQYLRETLMNSSSDYIFFKDRASRFIMANKAIAKYFGLDDPSLMIRKTDFDFYPESFARQKYEEEQTILRTGQPLRVEERQVAFNHAPAWVYTEKWPLRDKNGNIIGTYGLSRDISESKSAEDALAREQYLLQTLMDNSSDYIYFKDLDSRFIRTSMAHARSLGLSSPSQMIGKTDFDFFAEQHAKMAYADEREIIRTGQGIRKEETNLRLNGPEAWVLTEKLPLKDKEGNIIGTFGLSREITERKRNDERIARLLKEQETLLKEVHHRIKNNMTTISSLLSLQASTLTESEAIKALEDAGSRVQSMMVLYEKLYKSANFTEVSIKEYLSDLVDQIVGNFPNSGSIEIEKDIEDFILEAKTLNHLGLIVNELLTNIMKYAFEGRGSGTVGVSASLRDDHARLTVEDDGNGMPEGIDFKNSTGFGLMLVGMLTDQLGGAIRIERGKGTRIILEFRKRASAV